MVKGLWKAFDTRNAKISPPPLQAWCDKTFAWFADKTGPRCLDKCTALYCKPRCSLNKKYMDLRDQEVALKLRLDLSKKREERLDKTEGSLKEIADSISKFEAEKVQPALADLKAAQEAVDKLRGEMDKVGDAEKLRDAAEKASAEHKAALKAEGSSKALAAATEKAHGLEKDRNKQRLTVKNLEEQLKVVRSRLSQVKAQCAAQQAFTAKLLRSVIDEGTHLARLQGELRTAKETVFGFGLEFGGRRLRLGDARCVGSAIVLARAMGSQLSPQPAHAVVAGRGSPGRAPAQRAHRAGARHGERALREALGCRQPRLLGRAVALSHPSVRRGVLVRRGGGGDGGGSTDAVRHGQAGEQASRLCLCLSEAALLPLPHHWTLRRKSWDRFQNSQDQHAFGIAGQLAAVTHCKSIAFLSVSKGPLANPTTRDSFFCGCLETLSAGKRGASHTLQSSGDVRVRALAVVRARTRACRLPRSLPLPPCLSSCAQERAESFNGTNVTRAADQASALRGALGELKAKLVTEQQMLYQTMGLYEESYDLW